MVRVGDNAVAVVADTWWRAKKAVDAAIENGIGVNTPNLQRSDVAKVLRPHWTPQAGRKATARATRGAGGRRAQGPEAVYSYPHQNHATMDR